MNFCTPEKKRADIEEIPTKKRKNVFEDNLASINATDMNVGTLEEVEIKIEDITQENDQDPLAIPSNPASPTKTITYSKISNSPTKETQPRTQQSTQNPVSGHKIIYKSFPPNVSSAKIITIKKNTNLQTNSPSEKTVKTKTIHSHSSIKKPLILSRSKSVPRTYLKKASSFQIESTNGPETLQLIPSKELLKLLNSNVSTTININRDTNLRSFKEPLVAGSSCKTFGEMKSNFRELSHKTKSSNTNQQHSNALEEAKVQKKTTLKHQKPICNIQVQEKVPNESQIANSTKNSHERESKMGQETKGHGTTILNGLLSSSFSYSAYVTSKIGQEKKNDEKASEKAKLKQSMSKETVFIDLTSSDIERSAVGKVIKTSIGSKSTSKSGPVSKTPQTNNDKQKETSGFGIVETSGVTKSVTMLKTFQTSNNDKRKETLGVGVAEISGGIKSATTLKTSQTSNNDKQKEISGVGIVETSGGIKSATTLKTSQISNNDKRKETSGVGIAKTSGGIKRATTLKTSQTSNNDKQKETSGGIKSATTFKTSQTSKVLCEVPGCVQVSKYYFRVPMHKGKRKIWNFCLELDLEPGDVICRRHFIEEDLILTPNEGRLKLHAVPSQQEVKKGCCLPGCKNENENTPNMYAIPVWTDYKQKWRKLLNLYFTAKTPQQLLQYRICDLHYKDDTLSAMDIFNLPLPEKNLPSEKNWCDAHVKEYLKKIQYTHISVSQPEPQPVQPVASADLSNKNDANKDPRVVVTNSVRHYRTLNKGAADEPITLRVRKTSTKPKRLEDYCSFEVCCFNKETCKEFIPFPKNYDEAVKWLKVCNRMDVLHQDPLAIKEYIRKSIGLCSKHFDISILTKYPETVAEREVTDIPEIVEGNPNSDVESPLPNYVPTKNYCAFVNCISWIMDPVKKFRFPVDWELLEKWFNAAGIPNYPPDEFLLKWFVCGNHFKPYQYNEDGKLMSNCVPIPYIDYKDKHDKTNEHWSLKRAETEENPAKVYSEVYTPPVNPAITDLIENSGTNLSNTKKAVLILVDKHPQWINNKKSLSKENSIEMQDQSKKTNIDLQLQAECLHKPCHSKPKTNLYPFPNFRKENIKYALWVNAIENRADSKKGSNIYEGKFMCDRHFEDKYKTEVGLTYDAVPTLDLDIEDYRPESIKDTIIQWKEYKPNDAKTRCKGYAHLGPNSIQFPNISRKLKFGKDCKKLGLSKFPYKIYKTKPPYFNRLPQFVSPGFRFQLHTAVIIDDDDDAEQEAIKTISDIVLKNAENMPTRKRKRPEVVNVPKSINFDMC